MRLICLLTVSAALIPSSTASASAVLYGSPGPEQEQLQAWIDTSHARTPNVYVRLYEGNCEESRPGGHAPEINENPTNYGPGQTAPNGEVQTCAAFTPSSTGLTNGEAVYIGHIAWHPQYSLQWWHLNLLNELGHIYDEVVGTVDHHRQAFSAIYGYNSHWWWPINVWAALNKEWEKWSMGYAFCGYGMSYHEAHALIESGEYTGFGFDPGSQEYARTCYLMDHLRGRTKATGTRTP